MIIRFFDLVFSLLAILALSPLWLSIVFILRLSGEGEVFFFQDRVGKNHKLFRLLKFATMLKGSPNMGTGTITMRDDPRVLPVGRILRKTKINEIPQLINIVLGHMSIIGPRPQTPRCFNAFSADEQDIIVRLKPGLSGIGPVIFRGEEDILEGNLGNVRFYDNVLGPYKGKVEAWYKDNENIKIYFLLIFLTLWVIIFPKSHLVWRMFKDLPEPPPELKPKLNYVS